MKIARVTTQGVRGLPDRTFELTDPSSGRPFDVVLLDYVMPQKDGFALGGEIAADPAFGCPALIAFAFCAAGCWLAGVVGPCAKLVPPATRTTAINQAIRLRSRESEHPWGAALL